MTPPATTEPARSVDRTLSILANGPRREILRALASGRTVGRSELGRIRDRLGASETTFEVSLYHVHLPMLAAAEVVTSDSDPFRIQPGPRFESVAPLVEAVSAFELRDDD